MEIRDISPQSKAVLEIIIREIQDSLRPLHPFESRAVTERVEAVLETWIKANDLHPEKVQSIAL